MSIAFKLCLLTAVFASNGVFAQEDPLFRTVALPSTAGFEIGRGFDILTNRPRADCVERSIVEDHSDIGPNIVSFEAIRVENSKELASALGLSASASLKSGLFGGSATASFASNMSVDSYSLTYVVDARIKSKGESLLDVRLKKKYADLIKSGNIDSMERFRLICGDGYISEFVTGGGFQSIITISTSSKTEKERLSASLSASYSLASGSASFNQEISEISKTNRVEIRSLQRGGSGTIPLTPDEISEKIKSLPDSVAASPSPMEAVVFSYILLLDDPSIPLVDLSEREVALTYLSDLATRARDQQANAQYILDHPSEFYSKPDDIPLLAQEIGELTSYREHILRRADECINSGGVCEAISVELPLPTVRPARR
jgi:hypothetical protein